MINMVLNEFNQIPFIRMGTESILFGKKTIELTGILSGLKEGSATHKMKELLFTGAKIVLAANAYLLQNGIALATLVLVGLSLFGVIPPPIGFIAAAISVVSITAIHLLFRAIVSQLEIAPEETIDEEGSFGGNFAQEGSIGTVEEELKPADKLKY